MLCAAAVDVDVLWPYEGVIFKAGLGCACCMLCGLNWLGGSDDVESIDVLKLMCLGCCLFSVLMAFRVVVADYLGTLHLRIPRWSDAVYECRIDRHVESLKM